MADTPALRVTPLEFEKRPGSRGPQYYARSSLFEYHVTQDGTFLLSIDEGSLRNTRPHPEPFDCLAKAIKAAQKHHVAEVSKLLEPEDAQRARPSLSLLKDASVAIPDEAEILRLIKAQGSHRHVDIAKRIAEHLEPVRAALKMFESECRDERLEMTMCPNPSKQEA